VTAYYNEFDPKAAAWLRELIKRGLIADGEVDERSILDVSAEDLVDFTQCHFFAGIGGWSYALGLAGWPDDRPVWTGSPPCQPFSAAGQNKGKADERHLAPHFASLVAAGRPPILFGEQVASAAVFGKVAKRAGGATEGEPAWAWIDDLQDRLEAAHYAIGLSDIPAAGVGAPHIRQRTFFGAVRLADAHGKQRGQFGDRHAADGGKRSGAQGLGQQPWRGCLGDGLADSDSTGPQQRSSAASATGHGGAAVADGSSCGSSTDHGGWAVADWLFCRDGKWRPVEPGTLPLAHGVSARVVRLRGYGNAIVPQAAATFIEAFMQAHQEAAQ